MQPEIRWYRGFLVALLLSWVCHLVALAAMQLSIQPGFDLGADVLERASYVSGHRLAWRIGWFFWQLTAVSDLTLSLALLAYALSMRHSHPTLPRLAVAGVAATVLAVFADQRGEMIMVTSLVEQAGQLVAGTITPATYLAVEAEALELSAGWGNAGYTLMSIFWAAVALSAGGGTRRHVTFVTLTVVMLLLFSGCSVVIAVTLSTAPANGVYPGYGLLFLLNAPAFLLLILWMPWLGLVVATGHHRRRPAEDADLHEIDWPGGGLLSRFAPLINHPGVRDQLRIVGRVIPTPQVASDIVDVVYLNWLVPADRVAAMLPEPLVPDCFEQQTMISILSYRHRHFGPRFLGPLRRLFPSPCQSNWRCYVEPESEDYPRDAIYFFKTVLDHGPLVIGCRLMTDGLPCHRPRKMVHERRGDEYETVIDPGDGSAPDLQVVVGKSDVRDLPPGMQRIFTNWESAVKYLVDQNRAVRVLPGEGHVHESRIEIPIGIESVIPAAVQGEVRSGFLEPLVEGGECFAFVVPGVAFRTVDEGLTAPCSVE